MAHHSGSPLTIAEVKEVDQSGIVVTEVLVGSLEERTTKSGDLFYKVKLQDNSGILDVIVFDKAIVASMPQAQGRATEIVLEVGFFKGNLNYKIKELNYISRPPEDFIATAEIAKDLPAVHGFLSSVLDRFSYEPTRKLFEAFTTEKWVKRYASHAAAKEVHHAYRGGFLEHICTLMKVYAAIHDAKVYPELNSDVVFLGLLLHDIGKMFELEQVSPGVFDYTVPGIAQGHLVMSYRMCYEMAKELEIEKSPHVDHLLHVILAHHGTREFGSPVLPSTAEAFMVHHLDSVDAKLHIAFHGKHFERQPFLNGVRLLKYDATGDDLFEE